MMIYDVFAWGGSKFRDPYELTIVICKKIKSCDPGRHVVRSGKFGSLSTLVWDWFKRFGRLLSISRDARRLFQSASTISDNISFDFCYVFSYSYFFLLIIVFFVFFFFPYCFSFLFLLIFSFYSCSSSFASSFSFSSSSSSSSSCVSSRRGSNPYRPYTYYSAYLYLGLSLLWPPVMDGEWDGLWHWLYRIESIPCSLFSLHIYTVYIYNPNNWPYLRYWGV